MARIENHKYSIEEAFRECFYIVPDYQREYVWTDKEVHQLLEDIGEQIDASTTREYFIGTVLVSPTDQKNHYEVIDGQQRLTLLAPDIIEQFMAGKQPRRLTLMWFQRNRLMVDWHAQRQLMATFEEDV